MSAGHQVREILVVPHTHHDVGYTDTPRKAEAMHRESIRRGLEFASASAAPGRAQMKWTVEVSRPIVRLLHDEPQIIPTVLEAQRLHRLSVTGGYLNMTQLVGHDGYDRMFQAVHGLRGLGLEINTVQHGDVNGIGWGVVPAMLRAGLSTLVMALNPDHGRPPFEQPTVFWWEGPDGGRILVALDCHYGVGKQWGMLAGRAPDENVVAAFLRRLDDRDDYPFDSAVVHAAHDNQAPSGAVLHAVEAWNAVPGRVPMRIATIDEAVAAYRQGPLDTLASYRGEWADWWAHGHGSSAREVAMFRQAQRSGQAAQTILAGAFLDGTSNAARVHGDEWYGQPFASLDRPSLLGLGDQLNESLALFAEHTWGASESVRSPHSDFTRTHWQAKAAFAHDALQAAHELTGQALARLADPDPCGPDVHTTPEQVLLANPSNTARHELLTVPVNGGSVEVLADLEPFQVAMAPTIRANDVQELQHPGRAVIETEQYTLVIDPDAGGIVDLRRRDNGHQLVDATAEFPLASIVDEQPDLSSTHPMLTVDRRHFHPDHPGPAFRRCCAKTDPARPGVTQRTGAGWTDLRWHLRLDDILTADVGCTVIGSDIWVTATLHKRARYEPESVFVAFPFALSDARFFLETTDAVFLADFEQLPDTCRDWYSVQYGLGVVGSGTECVLWGTVDAPLVTLGGFHTGRWAESLGTVDGHVNSWLMNNLYFTNFRAAQSGIETFRYLIRPGNNLSREDVVRFGRELSRPVLARGLPSILRTNRIPHVSVQPDHLLQVTTVVALSDDLVRVHVASLSDTAHIGRLLWSGSLAEILTGPDTWAVVEPHLGYPVELGPHGEKAFYLRSHNPPTPEGTR